MSENREETQARPKRDLMIIGWIEHLDLPQLGLTQIKVKVDTGARTSALHAQHISTFRRDGIEWVRFVVPIDEGEEGPELEAPVHDRRMIKNTSGTAEERITIRTKMRLAGRIWTIPVSLSDRSDMRLPMILGRTALRGHNIAVHTRRTNLTRTLGHNCPFAGREDIS